MKIHFLSLAIAMSILPIFSLKNIGRLHWVLVNGKTLT